MATNFPTSLDVLTNPTSSDSLSSPSHSAQHANVNDAVEALQAKVGADSSAVTSSHDYLIADHASRLTTLEGASGGKILQVVSTTKTDTWSASLGGGADTAVTGLSATITPTSTSSTILVVVDINMTDASDAYARGAFRVYRGATSIAEGTAAGNRPAVVAAAHSGGTSTANNVHLAASRLDSPATTSATTYTVYAVNATTNTKTIAVNRTSNDGNYFYSTRPSSSITLMEVAA